MFPRVPEVERVQQIDLHLNKKNERVCRLNTYKCIFVDYLNVRSWRVRSTVYQATPVVVNHSANIVVLEFGAVVAVKDGWHPKLLDVGTYSLAACQSDSTTRKL